MFAISWESVQNNEKDRWRDREKSEREALIKLAYKVSQSVLKVEKM
jgi:hypothetical protein